MKLIYQNFDTLEISFQCALPLVILSQLEQAKKEAQSCKNAVYAEIGPNKLPVMVYEVGSRGGYTYQFQTGHDGEIWLFGDRENTKLWNARVRVKSLCLALYGYAKTKEKILQIRFSAYRLCISLFYIMPDHWRNSCLSIPPACF